MRRVALAALLVAGCADSGTVVVEVDLPATAGEAMVIQVAGAGANPELPLTTERATVDLTGAPQHVCVTVDGPTGEVNVRLQQCGNAICTGPGDSIPRLHTATIGRAIYAGKTTTVDLGAFRVDTHATVDPCAVEGCTDRMASSFCRLEDGAHFCEFMEDAPPARACDVTLSLGI